MNFYDSFIFIYMLLCWNRGSTLQVKPFNIWTGIVLVYPEVRGNFWQQHEIRQNIIYDRDCVCCPITVLKNNLGSPEIEVIYKKSLIFPIVRVIDE